MRTVFNAFWTFLVLVFLWSTAEQSHDKWIYVAFGVCLMLWPIQWAFDLGRWDRRNDKS